MTTDFNKAPYYDDYKDSKKYLRILFNPSRAVQARELTQIQTAIQDQIGKFGASIYKNGSKVLDAQIAFDPDAIFCKITATDLDLSGNITNLFRYFDIDTDMVSIDYLKKVIARQGYISTRDGVTGKTFNNGEASIRVVAVYPAIDVDTPATIIGKKMSGAALSNSTTYVDSVTGATFTSIALDAFGDSTTFTVNSGVFFVNNFFVYCDKQTVVTSKYTSVANIRAGLFVAESVVTSNDDQTLLDPARQTTNWTATGADRYLIDLQLQTREFDAVNPIDNVSGVDFVELVRIENGVVTNFVKYPYYSDLEDTLARRTYDESGNYTVTAFAPRLREHPTDNTKIQFGLDAGKAYINGYEHETISTNWLDIDKARDTNIIANEYIPTNFGNYVYVDTTVGTVTGALPITTQSFVNLYDNISGGSIIGTARVRQVYKESATRYRVYLTDVTMTGVNVFSAVRRLQSGAVHYDLLLESGLAVMKEPTGNSLIFTQPYSAVKAISEAQYNYIKVLPVASNVWTGAGPYTVTNISASTNESFIGTDNSNGYAPYTIIDANGLIRTITAVSVSAGNVTITISATGGAPGNSTLYAPVSRNASVARTKTLGTHTMSTAAGVGVINFNLVAGGRNYYDIFSIESIKHSGDATTEIKQKFKLNDGITDNYYGLGSVTWIDAGAVPTTGTFTIQFKSFDHSNDPAGSGYFTIDSYSSIPYSDVKTYFSKTLNRTYNLSDIVDFRPTISDTVASTDMKNQTLPIPSGLGSEFTAKIEFYMPRIDKVILSKEKIFSVIRGTAGIPPQEPMAPNGTMALYTINVPSYTFKALDATPEYIENKRYTMRDIGSIDRRVQRVEYYTALSLLEKQASDAVLTTSGGNVAFKNGILVDSFTNHSVGNVTAPDYRCAIDEENNFVRPMFESRLYSLTRTTGGQMSDDGIVTLPYTTEVFIDQPLGSKFINVNPYDVVSWAGNLKLTPSSDSWYDSITNPEVIINKDENGNFVSQGALAFGTVWSNWSFLFGGTVLRRTVTSTVLESTNVTSVTTGTVIPFMRQLPVSFNAVGLQPSTVVYAFFDDKPVATGSVLKTDTAGVVSGSFTIPTGVKTGTRLFRLVDNSSNDIGASKTYADAQFSAAGTLLTTQSTRINIVRNGTVYEFIDPLAESILVPAAQYPEGIMIDSVDVFFGKKDSALPITLQIRPTVNGFPSSSDVLPFSTVSLDPVDVTVIADVRSPNVNTEYTRFKFSSPVMLNPGEYAIVLLANSQHYEVMAAGIGETQLGTNNVISKQPYTGSLFKSQNASTWTASQEDDLAFRVNRCVFPVNTPATVTYTNVLDTQTDNFKYHLIYPKPMTLLQSSGAIDWAYKGTSSGGSADSGYTAILPFVNTSMIEEKRLLGTTVGEFGMTSTLVTTNEAVSPVVDLDRMGVVLVRNIVNTGFTGEDTPFSGTAAGKYITSPVSLNPGFESTGLDIRFLSYQPGIADVEVWYKAINSGAGVSFDTAPWVKASLTKVYQGDVIDDLSYKEYHYGVASIPTFNQYAVKLVFAGDGIHYPQVKDLRVIAYE